MDRELGRVEWPTFPQVLSRGRDLVPGFYAHSVTPSPACRHISILL
jgi:hypothetical protein